ncbi:Hsp20/alpha crystallin family protein [Calycomorphotria hydatis]|uniref:Spore protein SP21 n=1 Tax=Calycomorphotria hydatis TaxID=2528027 RepID=A0A517T3Y7_9PLAN|nr:Hsp20/alpha crystallin family protein [Calycomorphotria hydatis]QDT63085.1 Spore protein SP21 [Calycomorphotria hydatis]
MSDENTLTCSERKDAVSETSSRVFQPAADIIESETNYTIVLDVPGAGEDDVEITLEKDQLNIHARVQEPSLEGLELKARGYAIGDYHRTFRLSDGLDRTKIDATVNDGVLTVTLPKAEQSLAQKIEVKRQSVN